MTKIKKDYKQAREELRLWLSKWTDCEIQGGYTEKKKRTFGWPCGTCTINLLDKIGLKPTNPEYNLHNNPIDRTNEVWRAILQIRDEKIK